MNKTKIAIACQGGGSHTAFTAGVLKHLLSRSVHSKYDLVGLTGTSGGAICATAVWYGLAKSALGGSEPPYKTLIDFWRANAAQTPEEQLFAAVTGFFLKIAESGRVPLLPPNPYRDAAGAGYDQAIFQPAGVFGLPRAFREAYRFRRTAIND